MALADIKFSIRRGCKQKKSTMDEWHKNANAYRVTLEYQGRKTSLDFFTGKGWTKDPELFDVLDCIFSEVDIEFLTFEGFCGEFGYDIDSRRAERIFIQIKTQCQNLRDLLGDELEAIIDEFNAIDGNEE